MRSKIESRVSGYCGKSPSGQHHNFTIPRATFKPLMMVDPPPSFANRGNESF